MKNQSINLLTHSRIAVALTFVVAIVIVISRQTENPYLMFIILPYAAYSLSVLFLVLKNSIDQTKTKDRLERNLKRSQAISLIAAASSVITTAIALLLPAEHVLKDYFVAAIICSIAVQLIGSFTVFKLNQKINKD